jgi:hydroxyacylglutathione hydrolase
MSLEVRLLPLRQDNYAYLVRDGASGLVAVVDPSDAAPVLEALRSAGWRADFVVNTHHHGDHTDGNIGIADAMGAKIVAPAAERDKIGRVDIGVKSADLIRLGHTDFTAIATPGHTLGQLSYYSADAKVLFSGDTLFALGCGRVFEGTHEQMWYSLARLRTLPDETLIYCGHEYTQSNCRFALSVEPDNEALRARAEEIATLRSEGKPTVPSTMGAERATNPFLRADQPSLQAALGMTGAEPAQVFTELRNRKDNFR